MLSDLPALASTSPTTATTVPAPPGTGPGSVITIYGGPNATANIPGPHNDAADFWGSGLVILVIIGAIALTRLVFRRPGPPAEEARPGPPAEEARPGPPAEEAQPGPPPEA